jgi:hypothetical protein
MAANAASN